MNPPTIRANRVTSEMIQFIDDQGFEHTGIYNSEGHYYEFNKGWSHGSRLFSGKVVSWEYLNKE